MSPLRVDNPPIEVSVAIRPLHWFGVTAPAKLPVPLLATLNSAFARALQHADTREKLTAEGSELVGNSSTEFTAFLKSDLAKWAKVVKEAGIRVD